MAYNTTCRFNHELRADTLLYHQTQYSPILSNGLVPYASSDVTVASEPDLTLSTQPQIQNRGGVNRQPSVKHKRGPYDSTQSPTRAKFQVAPTRKRTQAPHGVNNWCQCNDNVRARAYLSPELGTPGVHGPTNHVMVPQNHRDVVLSIEPITFQIAGFPEPGINIGKWDDPYQHTLVGHHDKVLSKVVIEKYLSIDINWPGYPPATKRMLANKETITRQNLANALARVITVWAEDAKKQTVKQGYEHWAIGKAVNIDDVFITRMIHLGTSHWQAELWAPVD
ncbi:hypothetical protein FA15DRAFT_90898 [Coprinopsis marcescibilis]|uniref:Uncharacterized protein n=1 Tax=Coprinopsis marcescibilis TaxID=230819 RepID=A0A5C3L695_COPMA|nr:hypothetical protein FA15DRAFT_90898 [Coprinopsis marcescibilis]